MADELKWLQFYDNVGGKNTRYSATTTPVFDATEQQNMETIVRGGFRKIDGYARFMESPIVDESSAVLMRGSVLPTAESDAWTGAGPGTATSAVSGGIFTVTEDNAGAVSERYFNAEAGFTSGTDAVYEARCSVNSGYTASGVYVTSVCVLDDATDRFELVAVEVSGTKQIGVLTTTGDRTVSGSYSNLTDHDWTEFTRYRVTYDASGNVDVFINDLTTASITIAVSSLPASTETSRAAFGSYEAATTVVSNWDYVTYEIGALTLSTLAINGIHEFVDETASREILLVAGTSLYKYDSSTGYVTATTGGTAFTSGAKPHFSTFSDPGASNVAAVIITTEDRDTPQIYNGGSTKSDLGGSPPSGKFNAVYHERLFIANTSGEPAAVYFSGFGNPEGDDASGNWDTTNDVFLVDRFSHGEITGLAVENEMLFIFCERGVYRLQGWDQGSFLRELISGNDGCVAPCSIVLGSFGDDRRKGVFFRDRDGYKWTDGQVGNVIRVSEKIRPTLDDDVNFSQLGNEAAFVDRNRNLVGWGATLGTDTTNSIVYSLDYINGAQQQPDGYRVEGWMPFTFNLRAAGNSIISGKEEVLFSDHAGVLFQLNTGTNFDNADIDGFRTTAWMDGGAKHLSKIWRYLVLFIQATGDIDLEIDWGINYQDDFTDNATVNLASAASLLGTTFILGTSTLGTTGLIHVKVPIDITASAIRFRFRTDKKAEPFSMFGFSVGFEPLDWFGSNAIPTVT